MVLLLTIICTFDNYVYGLRVVEILIYFVCYLLLSMLGESAEKVIVLTKLMTRILGCFIRLISDVYNAYCWDQ